MQSAPNPFPAVRSLHVAKRGQAPIALVFLFSGHFGEDREGHGASIGVEGSAAARVCGAEDGARSSGQGVQVIQAGEAGDSES